MFLLSLLLLGCVQDKNPDSPMGSSSAYTFVKTAQLGETIQAFAVDHDGTAFMASTDRLFQLKGNERLEIGGLPNGEIRFLGVMEPNLLLAYVNGSGFHVANTDDFAWENADSGLSSVLLSLLNPLANPVPFDVASTAGNSAWLATVGGLFTTQDGGRTWSAVDTSSSGSTNPLFVDVVVDDDLVVAVSLLPEAIIPQDYAGLLSGQIFVSDDGGESWEDGGDNFPSNYASAVAIAGDTLFVGTLDQGVLQQKAGGWESIGGPTDVIALEYSREGLSVGSSSRGVWRYQNETWSQIGDVPIVGLANGYAADVDGQLYQLQEEEGKPPSDDAGGTVHIAISFHVNYYHSYRGDSPTDDGFGLDIDVIRNTLDWLDEHPDIHANWDMDNAFSTDHWMVEYSPDIIDRIANRVGVGTDEIRLMSWNNGAMASSTETEFVMAVERAFESNANAFGSVAPGVQPQECMFSPEHLEWYPENGVDWVTLFYSATGFTALREDIDLTGGSLYNPIELVDPLTGSSMTAIPAYHHADVLEHGGLSGWAKQISATTPGDSLLLVHFDADAESWEQFDQEIEQAKQLEFVRWTKISDYIANHEPVVSVEFAGDVADGTGDGFQSWAEKDFNHRLFTKVVQARQLEQQAQYLGGEGVDALLQEGLESRLLALSTTNYGLAAPLLHEDRVASATAFADDAVDNAARALEIAEQARPVPPNTLEVINPTEASGMALVEYTLILPAGSWNGPSGLHIYDDNGNSTPVLAALQSSDSAGDSVFVSMVMDVTANSTTTLNWEYDSAQDFGNLGSFTEQDATLPSYLGAPLIGCKQQELEGTLVSSNAFVDGDGLQAVHDADWSVSFCDKTATVRQRIERREGLPGVIVSIDAQLDELDSANDLRTVVLSPLYCDGKASKLHWKSYGGVIRERAARYPVTSWNGQSPVGWLGMECDTGTTLFVSHRMAERSSMAFAPLRNDGGNAMLAPLGTIWGDGPLHDARRTGGHGIGELITEIVGSQFRPAAPDWAGKRIQYRLLITEQRDESALDLFANPPLVRVGSFE